jgi:hypothetical protein
LNHSPKFQVDMNVGSPYSIHYRGDSRVSQCHFLADVQHQQCQGRLSLGVWGSGGKATCLGNPLGLCCREQCCVPLGSTQYGCLWAPILVSIELSNFLCLLHPLPPSLGWPSLHAKSYRRHSTITPQLTRIAISWNRHTQNLHFTDWETGTGRPSPEPVSFRGGI